MNEPREIQLVGGPLDGKTYTVQGIPLHLRFPIAGKLSLSLSPPDPSEPVKPLPMKMAIYRALSGDGGCCRYEFVGMDGEGAAPKSAPTITTEHLLAAWKSLLSAEHPTLKRIGEEFEDAIAVTDWARWHRVSFWLAGMKRYRVICVRVPHAGFVSQESGGLPDVWVSVLAGPMTFQEAQHEVDNYHYCHNLRLKEGREVFLTRAYMQEIPQ